MLQRELFSLKFSDDGIGVQKTLSFRADHAGEALAIARGEASDRKVELWKGTILLCRLYRDKRDFWRIN
jgi:hypothetical protein